MEVEKGMFRIAIGGSSHETHTFPDRRTQVEDFLAREVQYGDQVIEENRRVRNYIRGFVEVLDDAGQQMDQARPTRVPGFTGT